VKDTWVLRDYQSGDELQILNLYEAVNSRKMPMEYWRWRHDRSPFGRSIIKLIFSNAKLIGHYAVTPMDVMVNNRPLRAVFSLHTLTHPAFQRRGIFTSLAEEVYKECQSEGFSFVYGFPNSNSYNGFTNRLGWTGFGKMSSLERNLDAKARAASEARNINQIGGFDDRVNVLWRKIKSAYPIIVPRTKDYLNWRFLEHPIVEYPMYTITSESSELLGYMVLKVYRDGDLTKGHIVDMLSVDDEHTVRSLVNSAYDYFLERGIGNLSCWMPEGCFCTQILRSEGFVSKEFDVNFGVKIFEKANAALGSIEQLDNWHLTMSDLDVV